MAGKVIAQIVIQGVAVFSRAFVSAYNQALQNAQKGGQTASVARGVLRRMRTDEALKVLSIEQSALNHDLVKHKYEKLFTLNDPAKGGSFYLQSKVVRAKEALERELNGGDDPESSEDSKADSKKTDDVTKEGGK